MFGGCDQVLVSMRVFTLSILVGFKSGGPLDHYAHAYQQRKVLVLECMSVSYRKRPSLGPDSPFAATASSPRNGRAPEPERGCGNPALPDEVWFGIIETPSHPPQYLPQSS